MHVISYTRVDESQESLSSSEFWLNPEVNNIFDNIMGANENLDEGELTDEDSEKAIEETNKNSLSGEQKNQVLEVKESLEKDDSAKNNFVPNKVLMVEGKEKEFWDYPIVNELYEKVFNETVEKEKDKQLQKEKPNVLEHQPYFYMGIDFSQESPDPTKTTDDQNIIPESDNIVESNPLSFESPIPNPTKPTET